MAIVTINDTNLTNIAEAIREKNTGKTITNEVVVGTDTSYSPNATGFNSYDGAYANSLSITDSVRIPGATKIKVKIAYQTESTNYDYVTITPGVGTATDKLGGTVRTEKEFEFPGTDTVSFYFKSDGSNGDYLGYYAEITGYGEEVIDLSTVTYKPSEMAAAISAIEAGGGGTATPVKFEFIHNGSIKTGPNNYQAFDVSNATTMKFKYTFTTNSSYNYQAGDFAAYLGYGLELRTGDSRYVHKAVDSTTKQQTILSARKSTTSAEVTLDVAAYTTMCFWTWFDAPSSSSPGASIRVYDIEII